MSRDPRRRSGPLGFDAWGNPLFLDPWERRRRQAQQRALEERRRAEEQAARRAPMWRRQAEEELRREQERRLFERRRHEVEAQRRHQAEVEARRREELEAQRRAELEARRQAQLEAERLAAEQRAREAKEAALEAEQQRRLEALRTRREPPSGDEPEKSVSGATPANAAAPDDRVATSPPPEAPSVDDEVARVRARIERDAEAAIARNQEALLAEFVEIVDDLDRALDSAKGRDDDLSRGVAMVRDRFLSKLGLHGVERVDVRAGDRFDPEQHEAIATIPSPVESDGRIVEVLRPAYRVGDHVTRPAQVVVGRRA